MQLTLLLAAVLSLLATASPLIPRAGGPEAKPIPKSCTVVNLLPHAVCGTANVDGFMPSSTFSNANLLYQAYFESSLSVEAQAKQCK